MDTESLRVAVYAGFAASGRAPSRDELGRAAEGSPTEVDDGLIQLADQRHLVLDAVGEIVMAHPFSARPLGFSAMGATSLWWGGCAWDSFALPHLLHDEEFVLVATTCPGCGNAMAWKVDRHGVPPGRQVAHFLIPAARMWDDVVHTCGNQRLFCSENCVEEWLQTHGHNRGYVMDLATLWRLAEHWYDGRLDHGYVRREPAQSQDYLRSVGLSGPFWGL